MIRLFGSRGDQLAGVAALVAAVGALVALAPVASASPNGNTTVGPIMAVLGVGPPNLAADLRRRVEDAAAAGLKASGAELRSPGSPGVEYGVRGDLTVDGNTYRLRLQVTQLPAGGAVLERTDTCDICTAAELTEMTNLAVSALRAELLRRRPTPARTQGAATPAVAAAMLQPQIDVSAAAAAQGATTAAEAPDVSLETNVAPEPASSERPLWRTVAAWTAVAASVAAFGTSVYYLSKHNDFVGVEDGQGVYYDSTWYIAAGAAGGVIMGAVALGLFVW